MMLGNSRSKIVHCMSCVYTTRISEQNCTDFKDKSKAKAAGYRMCKCCAQISRVARLKTNDVKEYCVIHKIELYTDEDKAYIKTPTSDWVYSESCQGNATLLHKNTCGDLNGYHVQNCNVKTFVDALEYIVRHDEYRLKTPIRADSVKRRLYFLTIKEDNSLDDVFAYLYQGATKRPQKRSKKYKRIKNIIQAEKKKQAINKVLNLIDELSTGDLDEEMRSALKVNRIRAKRL